MYLYRAIGTSYVKIKTMKKSYLILPLLLITFSLVGQSSLEQQLFGLPDVMFKKIDTPDGFEAAYELHIKQPLDHKNPEKGHFYQRAYLSHKSYDLPTVMAIEGYHRTANRVYELTRYIDANQINIEHRYFGTSVPDSMDYQYLHLEQVAADLHKINTLFKELYNNKWISTGISKGGQTTIFYRYFYPEDVDVAVPYVAPLNHEYEDKRIYDFLAKVGSDECRADIKFTQDRLLEKRDEILPLLKWYAKGANHKFTYMSLEQAFEYGVLEYPFSFFQWGFDCDDIPADDATTEELLEHFMDIVGIAFYSDKDVAYYASHYYQAATEMGYYGFETEPFAGKLKALQEQPHPHAAFVPGKIETTFNGTLTNKVADWLAKEGDEFIYLYGEIDTWSATAVPPSKKTNSVWFMMEGKDHRTCRIKYMTEEEKAKLENTLEEWLEISIEN